jgi:hypothetical protein
LVTFISIADGHTNGPDVAGEVGVIDGNVRVGGKAAVVVGHGIEANGSIYATNHHCLMRMTMMITGTKIQRRNILYRWWRHTNDNHKNE